jgi:hypothetical protein
MAVVNLTFNQKRICLGIVLGVSAICLANFALGWSLFGRRPIRCGFAA